MVGASCVQAMIVFINQLVTLTQHMCVGMLSNCTQNMNNFVVWAESVDKYHLIPELSTHLPFDNGIKMCVECVHPKRTICVQCKMGNGAMLKGERLHELRTRDSLIRSNIIHGRT